jgi:hypothetical protein
MKTYRLEYQDKDSNELKVKFVEATNIKYVRKDVLYEIANSMDNDLKRIKISLYSKNLFQFQVGKRVINIGAKSLYHAERLAESWRDRNAKNSVLSYNFIV